LGHNFGGVDKALPYKFPFTKAFRIFLPTVIGVTSGGRGKEAANAPQYFFNLEIVFALLNWIMANKK
jgi:hypothetical protein